MTWQNVRPWLLDSASHTDRTQGCQVPWGSGQSSPRGWQRFSTDTLQTAPGWGCRRIYQWIPEVCAHTLKMMKMKNVTLEYNVCYDIIWTIKKGKLRIQAIIIKFQLFPPWFFRWIKFSSLYICIWKKDPILIRIEAQLIFFMKVCLIYTWYHLRNNAAVYMYPLRLHLWTWICHNEPSNKII